MKYLSLSLALCFAAALPCSSAETYKLIHAFEGGDNDGRTPTFQSSLTVSGSTFYGMTEDGGKYTNGVVFQVNTDGSAFKIIHTFDGLSILNPKGSIEDGAYPMGTPVLDGSILYGMTEQGGSNGYIGGTVFSVNTDGSDFKVLHHFGGLVDGLEDGLTPTGSVTLSGSTLYGLTSSGGEGEDEGVLFSMETDGSGYKILHSFNIPGSYSPHGTLYLSGSVLYGMTLGSVFQINTDGTGFQTLHTFAGSPNDGASAYGSPLLVGSILYGMSLEGGANSVGALFALDTANGGFEVLHNFAVTEAFHPYGDLALSGSRLYGMSFGGSTNYHGISGGSGAVFAINTDGSDYQLLHVFLFPATTDDGSLPYGTPLVIGSELYGMTSLGGSEGLPLGKKDGGCIFALTLPAVSGTGGPTITTASPLPNGALRVAYHQQLAADGGETPYTWAVSSGHLPHGLTLSTSGLLSGKPSAGGTEGFEIKVTGHNKMSASANFTLTIEAPPTLTVTVPKPNTKVKTSELTIAGTASGTEALAGVYFQLNDGAWTEAQSANGFLAWDYPNLALAAEANTLRVYAVDTAGNYSKTNSVKFTYSAK